MYTKEFEITKISHNEMEIIIETRKPIGLFYEIDINTDRTIFVGCDNTSGDAWVEEFTDFGTMIAWLCGEIEIN